MFKRRMVSTCIVVLLALTPLWGAARIAAVEPAEPVEPAPIVPVPVVKYVMASPRACLIGPMYRCTNAWCCARGAAENFPRANGAMRVPVGTRVVFCQSREMEGVWYDRSYGCLGTSLVLQWCPACKCDTCEPADDDTAAASAWVTIGSDGAKDVRRGPSIGRAKVGVPVRFRKAGIYYLRGIVKTFARPRCLRPVQLDVGENAAELEADEVLPAIPAAVDKDVVYVRVHVVNWPTADAEPLDEAVDDPDVTYIKPMPKDADVDQMGQTEATLGADEPVDWVDPDVLLREWGPDCEVPF